MAFYFYCMGEGYLVSKFQKKQQNILNLENEMKISKEDLKYQKLKYLQIYQNILFFFTDVSSFSVTKN